MILCAIPPYSYRDARLCFKFWIYLYPNDVCEVYENSEVKYSFGSEYNFKHFK